MIGSESRARLLGTSVEIYHMAAPVDEIREMVMIGHCSDVARWKWTRGGSVRSDGEFPSCFATKSKMRSIASNNLIEIR